MKAAVHIGCLFALTCLATGCQPSTPRPTSPQPVSNASSAPTPHSPRRAQMLQLVAYIDEVFARRYAPETLKRKQLGWDRKAEMGKLRATIEAAPEVSTHDFQRALYRFFRSMRDIHTDIVLAQDPAVVLGVRLRRVGASYVISCIDRVHLPKDRFPFELGDEVVRFGDVPVAVAIQEAKKQTLNGSTPGFEQRLAELVLTIRTAREWDRRPEVGREQALTVRGKDGKEKTVKLSWLDYDAAPQGKVCPIGSDKKSRIPELGKVVWRPDGSRHYSTYVFEHGRHRYGYLRFHTYALEQKLRLEALAQLDDAIAEFEKQGIEKLVLDQVGNGGGDFPFAYTLFSRLTKNPLPVPRQRFLIDDDRVVGFGRIGELSGVSQGLAPVATDEQAASVMASHPLFAGPLGYLPKRRSTLLEFRGFLDFFQRYASSTPQHRLTEPHYELLSNIEPARDIKPFGGPILMLIDAWNISAAEYAAAALQDSGRARLLGATTAGAGGDQRVIVADRACDASNSPFDGLTPCAPAGVADAMQAFGIRQFSYTVTVGVRMRSDGKPGAVIENRGVTPDVLVPATWADLRGGFDDLREKILDELTRM